MYLVWHKQSFWELYRRRYYFTPQDYCHLLSAWPDPEEVGGQGSGPPPLKNHKNIGFLSNTGPDPLKNHKATKPAFNVGPSPASETPFKWRFASGPMMVRF